MAAIMLTTVFCSISASSSFIEKKAIESKESRTLKIQNEIITIRFHVVDSENNPIKGAVCKVLSNRFGEKLDQGTTGRFGYCTVSGDYLSGNNGVSGWGILLHANKIGYKLGASTIHNVQGGKTYTRTIILKEKGESKTTFPFEILLTHFPMLKQILNL